MSGSDSCYIFGCSSDVDVLTASNTDVKLPETRTGHFARLISSSSFDKNTQTRPQLLVLANFITCLPPGIPRGIGFIP